jgi:phosphoribosylformimino-5-aminoimidazole carboxamide ribotide isomerase
MRIIAVMDLMAGQVVRGVGGRRNEYSPVVSQLTSSCDPLDVALAFRASFGVTELYLADLDAIAGAPAALPLYAALRSRGFSLWVDAGLRDAEQAAALVEAGVEGIVFGLETLAGPAELTAACQFYGDHVVFSLDLMAGMPLGDRQAWRESDAWAIAQQAIAGGVRRIILLDLARVGSGVGTGTEELCARLAVAYPDLEIIAGGGVRRIDDLRRLKACGVSGVLVASALHDGTLTRESLALG